MPHLIDRVPGLRRLARLPQQLLGRNPFGGDCRPTRIPLLFQSGRTSLPFPHPWNYQRPIDILETYFFKAEQETASGRDNRYLDVPGYPPILVTRDPAVIRGILTATGDREGQFDRDTLPSTGIARATGQDSLLFGNGPLWRRHRKASSSPFGKTALFQPDVFADFEATFGETVRQRMLLLRKRLIATGSRQFQVAVEPEIKSLMLEMLLHCFFGTEVEYQQIREHYVPALERVIDDIVRDTVVNPMGLPRRLLARFSRHYAQIATDFRVFDDLTDRVLKSRSSGLGLWKKFSPDIPDNALRSNIKVFLAGALEATTSYATWAISHLARHPEWQEKVYCEVEQIAEFSPECLERAAHLGAVLDETLRLTPSLYFLPRRATTSICVQIADGRELVIPQDTHILLDVWHANRHEDHWGRSSTGWPADEFAPQRWQNLTEQGKQSKDYLHFGFGHGPRVCPGKHLGQLEVALTVGVFVKLFRFRAVHDEIAVKAGVSTKPADATLLELELREPSAGMTSEAEWSAMLAANESRESNRL